MLEKYKQALTSWNEGKRSEKTMNLKAKVGLDTTGFDAGLKRMKTKADAFIAQTSKGAAGGAMAGLGRGGLMGGLMGIPVLGGIIRKTFTGPADEAARIRDESAKIGVAAETFQHLDYAARQSGGSIEDVGKAFAALSVRQRDAIRGNKEYTEAFARYGISVDQLKSQNTEQLFMSIAKAVESGKNQMFEMADLQTLLGRGGKELRPTFQAGLGAAIGESLQIGAPMTAQMVKEYAAYSDMLTKANQQLSRMGYAALDLPSTATASVAVGIARRMPGMEQYIGTARLEQMLAEKLDENAKLLQHINLNTKPLKNP